MIDDYDASLTAIAILEELIARPEMPAKSLREGMARAAAFISDRGPLDPANGQAAAILAAELLEEGIRLLDDRLRKMRPWFEVGIAMMGPENAQGLPAIIYGSLLALDASELAAAAAAVDERCETYGRFRDIEALHGWQEPVSKYNLTARRLIIRARTLHVPRWAAPPPT
jgi:hypothetical protein